MPNSYQSQGRCVHGIIVIGLGNAKNCVHCNKGIASMARKWKGYCRRRWKGARGAAEHHAKLE
jgi:hypothetical protein